MLKYTDYDIVFQEIPNEVTLAINLSNCPHRCKGCHSPQLMQDIGNHLTRSELENLLSRYGSSITCVCFMGGDASPDTVEHFAAFIKQKTLGRIKTAWYSGVDKLSNERKINNFNFIKVGGYKEDLGGLDSKTTNQRLYKVENNSLTDITVLMQKR